VRIVSAREEMAIDIEWLKCILVTPTCDQCIPRHSQ
jgi:hypothetical protein